MICMKLVKSVKSYNSEMWDCVFFEEGNYLKPIMILPDFMLENFYKKMEKEKDSIRET